MGDLFRRSGLGLHHTPYAADLGIAYQQVYVEVRLLPIEPQRFQRNVQADPVTVLKTIGYGLGWRVYPQIRALNGVRYFAFGPG